MENITYDVVDYYGHSENVTDISNSSTVITYTYEFILQIAMYFIYKIL